MLRRGCPPATLTNKLHLFSLFLQHLDSDYVALGGSFFSGHCMFGFAGSSGPGRPAQDCAELCETYGRENRKSFHLRVMNRVIAMISVFLLWL